MAPRSRITPPSAHSIRQSPGSDIGLAQHHQPALETAGAGDLVETFARCRVELVVDAHHHMRRRDDGAEAFGGKRRDLGQGFACDKGRGEPTRNRDGDLDGFSLQPALDRLHLDDEAGERRGDALIGGGGPAVRLAPRLRFGGRHAALMAAQLRRRDRCLVLLGRDPRRRLLDPAEIGVEQEFRTRRHRGVSWKAVPSIRGVPARSRAPEAASGAVAGGRGFVRLVGALNRPAPRRRYSW
jgi:hypothetical protein